VEARIKSYAAIRIGGTGAEFTAFIAREQQVWTDVITANNIRLGE
jgi:hypothetical protein